LMLPIPLVSVTPIRPIPRSFLDHLHQLPLSSDRHLFESPELLVSLVDLLATLDATVLSRTPSHQCHGVSDGTEVQSCMAFAWVLAGPDGCRLAQCASSFHKLPLIGLKDMAWSRSSNSWPS
jgi:hypothetical protein